MENEQHIKKCANFKRVTTPVKREIEFCMETAVDMHCAGFSDLCPIPNKFKPLDGTKKTGIIFKNE